MYRENYGKMAAPYSQVLMTQRRLGELQIASLQAWEELWRAKVSLENYGLGSSVETGGSRTSGFMQSDVGAMVRSTNGAMVGAMEGQPLQ